MWDPKSIQAGDNMTVLQIKITGGGMLFDRCHHGAYIREQWAIYTLHKADTLILAANVCLGFILGDPIPMFFAPRRVTCALCATRSV